MFIWIDPQWDTRTTAALDKLIKVSENGREEATDLKEDCEIANKQPEATAAKLNRVKAKLERVEKEKESILCELNRNR
jgi:DNA-binding PadR family transcriptional regulator